MYLTYEEYQNMGGTLDETTFNDLIFEAESILNHYTFNRLVNDTEFPYAVKRSVYEILKLVNNKANTLNSGGEDGSVGQIASQSNDGVSISYNVLSASDLLSASRDETSNIIKMYLQGVKNEAGRLVLYRGVYSDE